MKEAPTAAGLGPPALHCVIAGSGVGLQELTGEAVHRRVSAQGVGAGADVGLRVDTAMTGGEWRLLQEITAVVGDKQCTNHSLWYQYNHVLIQ